MIDLLLMFYNREQDQNSEGFFEVLSKVFEILIFWRNNPGSNCIELTAETLLNFIIEQVV
jgi:hypothetical protein